jgi:DNA-binding MarR family transcriptional regulator
VPASIANRTVAILGQKGSGKTYTAGVLTEELLAAGLHVVVMDPLGVWWGLQSNAKGTGPGFPIIIFGGEHANVPLEPSSGELVAEFVVKSGKSCILDMSHFDSNAEQDRFVTAFLHKLFRLKAKEKSSLHLVMDEADSFIPQQPLPGQQVMLGAGTAIVRRGRSRGLGMTMITQRPAVLNKDALEMSDLVICHRFVGKLDRKAIVGTVAQHAADDVLEKFENGLAVLDDGECWAWSPQYLKIFERVKIRRKTTFNSSKTPDPGQRVAKPKAAAAVDLAKLTSEIKAAAEQVKANDPAELRRQIAELQRQLNARAPVVKAEKTVIKRVEVPAIKADQINRLDLAAVHAGKAAAKIQAAAAAVISALRNCAAGTSHAPSPSAAPPAPPSTPLATAAPRSREAIPAPGAPPADAGALSKGERKILTAIAQYPGGAALEQLTVLTGYKKSSRNEYIRQLRGRGLVNDAPNGSESLVATPAGIAALGEFKQLPTGRALIAHWLEKLSGGEHKIFSALVNAGGAAVSREMLGEATGYKKSSLNEYLRLLIARRLVEPIDKTSDVRAAAMLFREGTP